MSYFFDNNNRYQIIYPFTSEKIHVATNITIGAQKCYQEIKDNNIVTPVFIVHDIDQSNMYYFDIPKYKNVIESGEKEKDKDTHSLQNNITPNININQNVSSHHYDSIVTRLNHVECELDEIKKMLTLEKNINVEKNEELSCNIM